MQSLPLPRAPARVKTVNSTLECRSVLMCNNQCQRPLVGRRLARRSRGVTLVELMITISVLVILTTIGIPSFSTLIHNNRVARVANDLTLAMTLARSEAVKRGAPVRVCASANGVDCDITNPDDCHADWSVGWIVLPENGDPAVRMWGAVSGDIGPVARGRTPWVTFDGLGATRLPDCATGSRTAFQVGNVDEPDLRQRVVDILPSGRVALLAL
ncbi:GspH/FimT family pseudopilin [Thiohalocapsa halophila]